MSSVATSPSGLGRSLSRAAAHRSHPPRAADTWFLAAAVFTVGAFVLGLSVWAYLSLPPAMLRRPPQAISPAYPWMQVWSWWDGAWYVGIARRGYGFIPGRQSSVAFFPAYPLLVRFAGRAVGDWVLGGFLVTLTSGVGAIAMFHRWCVERLGSAPARYALAGLLLYPCSFFLFGKLYADALFLAAVLAAFLLLERDHPVLAGLAGAVATATRPIGVAVVIGLWMRALERRAAALPPEDRPASFAGRVGAGLRGLQRRDAGVLLAPAGLVAYATYLWLRFGSPLVFIRAEEGWHQAPGWHTWLKIDWWRQLKQTPVLDPQGLHLIGHALVTVLALALVPLVFRRFGKAYGTYVLVLVLGCAVSTNNFMGMGRYLLGAFPLFATVGALLARRRIGRYAVLVTSAVLLAFFTQLHARNVLIS